MKKDKSIGTYATEELKARRAKNRTKLGRADAMTDEKLERLVAEDERGLQPDWTRARLILPQAGQSVHLRLEQETVEYFKSQGRGHISRTQAVLKPYVDAHKSRAKG